MAHPFQFNAFQQNAFDTGEEEAFQPCAFDSVAFQTNECDVVPIKPPIVIARWRTDQRSNRRRQVAEYHRQQAEIAAQIESEDEQIMDFIQVFLEMRDAA
jgi:hypothetical protein